MPGTSTRAAPSHKNNADCSCPACAPAAMGMLVMPMFLPVLLPICTCRWLCPYTCNKSLSQN